MQHTEPQPLFRVLGPLEIRDREGEPIEYPAGLQHLLLLLLLRHADEWVPVEDVVAQLWPGRPPRSAKENVRRLVWRWRALLPPLPDGPPHKPLSEPPHRPSHGQLGQSRGQLGPSRGQPQGQPRIEGRRGAYRLRAAEGELDSRVFERLTAEGARAADARSAVRAFEAGLALWRGTPFEPGVPGVLTERLRLLDLRQQARDGLAGALVELGRFAVAARVLREMVALEPFREQAWVRLIEALDRGGSRAEALGAFEEIRSVLRDELGVTPGLDLARLHRRLIADPLPVPRRPEPDAELDTGLDTGPEPAVTPEPGPNHLPRDVPGFVDRLRELGALLDAARGSPGPVIEAIDGMPGAGKTALAVHAAHLLAAEYPGGQLFLDLCGHSAEHLPIEPEVALEFLLRFLGLPPDGIPDGLPGRMVLWRAALARRRSLVVLDNAFDARQVEPLLPAGPGTLVLVTSRRRLTSLDGVNTVTLDVLPERDAVQLFRQGLDPRRPGMDDADVAEIVRLCGGLPLAVRLAASRLLHRPAWSAGQLAARLRDGRGRLAELRAGERGVGASFELSYQRLVPEQRRLLRLLGVHPGPDFTGRMAAAIADRPPPDTERLLEDLLDAHLVEQASHERYRLHELVRWYALGKAEATDSAAERAAATRRMRDVTPGDAVRACSR